MTEQAIIYFIHSFFHPNTVTDPRICRLPCQSQKWISHVLPVHPGYLKFHIFILETLLSPSRPIYQYFPSPAPQKTTPPLSRLLHFIKLHCHPPSCSCQKPKSLPSIYSFFSHCILPAYKQILSNQFYPQNTPQRHSHPSLSIASSAIQATIISHMDYCNHYQ